MSYRSYQQVFLFCLTLLSLPVLSFSQADDGDKSSETAFTPNISPTLQISTVKGEIVVDGDLSDAGWQNLTPATNFSEFRPGDNVAPKAGVEAWMTYNDEFLYVAFKIEDDPENIRATFQDRDQFWSDDRVGIMIDAAGGSQQSVYIGSNPLGIQGDTKQVENGGEDESYDLIYKSEGRITATGYTVEMAIPFRSLRFPKQDIQKWRINLMVNHPREDRRQYAWASIDRDNSCFICQFGNLEGLEGIESSGGLELLPALTGAQSGNLVDSGDPNSDFDQGKFAFTPSITAKYSITSDLIADFTLNPDFSQIEADAAQIDVNNTFALSFPERRPFFQEGSDLFRTYDSIIYSRSINNPIAATKLTGRFGNTQIAYIGAQDDNSPYVLPFEQNSAQVQASKSFSNILRMRHGFSDGSYVGLIGSDRRAYDGGSGSTFGTDGLYRINENYQLEWLFVGSHTQEPNDTSLFAGGNVLQNEGTVIDDTTTTFYSNKFDGGRHTDTFDGESYLGNAMYVSFERNARHWNMDFDYRQYSPTFRAENGFIRVNNRRSYMLYNGYSFYPEDSFINQVRPGVRFRYVTDFAGNKKRSQVWTDFFADLKGQTFVYMGFGYGDNVFLGQTFSGMKFMEINAGTNFSQYFSIGFWTGFGDGIRRTTTPELGDNWDFSAWGTLKPTSRLKISPEFNYSRLRSKETGEDFYSGYVTRARFDYQFTRQLFVRIIAQYNSFGENFSIDPLITYKINPFSAFYIGSTHNLRNETGTKGLQGLYENRRQIFFKFQYLFRI